MILNKVANFLDKHNIAYQLNKNSLVFYAFGGSVKYKLKEDFNGSYYLHKYFYANKVYFLEWSRYVRSLDELLSFITKVILEHNEYIKKYYNDYT